MNRIELLASLAGGSNTLCDIGCDHAYVLISAIKKYDVKRGIAADVAYGPLSTARESITSAGLLDKIEIVLSDGFKAINSDFDTAIIAGMGGILISNILKDGINKIKNKKLILEPNSDAGVVRSFLVNNGFMIVDEFAIIEKNKYYEVIVAEAGNASYTDFEIKYGPILLMKKDPIFISHYQNKIENLKGIISRIENANIRNTKEVELKEYIEIIK